MSSAAAAGPASAGSALARCIALPASQFAAEHWGRAPLLTRAPQLPSTFDDLFNPAAVDELVSTRGLRTPFLRMAKDGNVLPSRSFTRAGGAGASIADQAADDRILTQLADGATLVLQALHRNWPPLVTFGSRLAAELGHPVQINAYITPAQSRGFASHYDVHDVFVLQISGRKRWRIFAPVVVDPVEDQTWEQTRVEVAARADGDPLIDCVLEPGDALYLPRGAIHAAEALGETSIHLTVGVHPITRYHLVRALLDLAAGEPELRRSLPLGTDLSEPQALAPHLSETVDILRSWLPTAALDDVARQVGNRLTAQTRPEPIAPLAQLDTAARLELRTPLRLRAGLRVRLADGADRVALTMLDRTISLPAGAADALKTVLGGDVFLPGDLSGLADQEQLTLARRLLREGVVVPVDSAPRADAS